MPKRLQVYHTDELVVTFDPNLCIHSANCLKNLPAVFDVARARWIDLGNGSTDEVVAAVAKCPSGALQAVRAGNVPRAAETPVSTAVDVTVKPNGPLLVRGKVLVTKESGDQVEKDSCAFCRCGATKNAPFCDGSHNRIGFKSPS